MKNEYKIHDLGQPDWVQLGIEVYAWHRDTARKERGVLVGYNPRSSYPYKVNFGSGTTAGYQHVEPVRRWVPQPGELVVVKITKSLFLRMSAGCGYWIKDAKVGGVPSDCGDYAIYRLPEGMPLHELSSDPEWWEKHAEKYEGGE